MKDDYKRLLAAALALRQWDGPTEVANGLTAGGYEVQPQMLTNWKNRGVSKDAKLRASRIIGCRAEWLDTGVGDMSDRGIVSRANLVTEGKPDGSHQELLPRQSIGPTNGLRRFPVLKWTDSPRFESATPERHETLLDDPDYSARCFAVVMPDDAMQMTIPQGNTLIIDPDRPLEHEGAFLFDGPAGPIVRRVRRGVTGWMLAEEDGRNSPAEAMPSSLVKIGRVMFSGRKNP